MKRSLRSGVRQLLGVPADESLQSFVERRGERAYRSVERLMQGLGIAPLPAEADVQAPMERVARPEPTKFDLGQGRAAEPPREHLPWGYGRERVTAMPVDPDRLYVYWEVTDEAIARARDGLGAAGVTAWLSLRVYDVTGRIFDGTNAHHYFDHRVERHDRQWFLTIGRPSSSACVEVGMKSSEGFFVRIARSARVDFPRAEPAPPGDVEWMSVHAATGAIEGSHTTAPPPSPAPPWAQQANGAAVAVHAAPPLPPERDASIVARNGARAAATERRWALGDGATEWLEVAPGPWHEMRSRHEWIGDVEHTSWEAGPFPHPVEAPTLEVIERRSEHGRVVETEDGTHVVEWPWEVTIRGLGAHVERRVLARWEIVRSVATDPDVESSAEGAVVALGGSELQQGASERRIGMASELRLTGASEEFFVGASELRFRGASERVYVGASERRWLGASERVAAGEGAWRLGGASEWRPAGASEHRLGGASEQVRGARASWQAFAEEGSRLAASAVESVVPNVAPAPPGASERRLAGSEGRLGATPGTPAGTGDAADAGAAASSQPGVRPLPPRW